MRDFINLRGSEDSFTIKSRKIVFELSFLIIGSVGLLKSSSRAVKISILIKPINNVRFLFREKFFLDPSKDRADFIPGFIGSYPNYFFVIDVADLPDFLDILDNYDGSAPFVQRLDKYGVNRADENFWDVYDWFQEKFNETDKGRAGLADLNRYYYRAKK